MIFEPKKTMTAEVLNEENTNEGDTVNVIKTNDSQNNENTVIAPMVVKTLEDQIPVDPPIEEMANNPFFLNDDAQMHVHVRRTF